MGWGSFEIVSVVFTGINLIDVIIEVYIQKHIVKGKEY